MWKQLRDWLEPKSISYHVRCMTNQRCKFKFVSPTQHNIFRFNWQLANDFIFLQFSLKARKFVKLKYDCLFKTGRKKERRRTVPLTEIRGITEVTEIEACQIIIVSRRYLTRVHGDESSNLPDSLDSLLNRRMKWPQRIPFSRSDASHLWWSEIPYTPNYFHS